MSTFSLLHAVKCNMTSQRELSLESSVRPHTQFFACLRPTLCTQRMFSAPTQKTCEVSLRAQLGQQHVILLEPLLLFIADDTDGSEIEWLV